ncbi:MAG: DUF3795 domain-containing protein [Candidatus Aminicenantes bacterium]
MASTSFANVKNQIGYCGIWCGSCVAGNGALKELTKKYAEIIDRYDLKDWAPKDFDFEEFRTGLTSIEKMPLCPGCLKEGGRPDCEIRTCARDKNLDDCSQCDTPLECPNVELLKTMQTGAVKANLLVKTEDVDREKTLKKYMEEIRSLWPSSVIFL